jgi:hypothetical protein
VLDNRERERERIAWVYSVILEGQLYKP